jgi:hypothetical protein
MSDLNESFEEVADWCERHLEGRQGWSIGMTLGAMLRAYGRLATIPPTLHGNQRAARETELNDAAEKLLSYLSTHWLADHDLRERFVDPLPGLTNFMYDTGRLTPPQA